MAHDCPASGFGFFVAGGIAYAFIVAMALTSFDRSANWIGPRAWKVLHTTGAYYIWISFTIAFSKRILYDFAYVIPVVVLVLAMAFRFLPLLLPRKCVAG